MKMFLKEMDHLNELRQAGEDMTGRSRMVCLSVSMPTVILGLFASCCNVTILENT